jgi:cyclohexyl-isocyanide hydratase
MNRRDFNTGLAAATLAIAATREAGAQSPSSTTSSPKPLEVGMLLFPDLTLLDLIGPQTVLSSHSNIHLVWKTKDVIYSDRGIGIKPNATFDECPADLDVLFVPGGAGMLPVMRDREVLDFLVDRGRRAKYVTSVCTGALVLGTAGLLNGYKATTHWAAREVLRVFGAEPVTQRVVVDRNRITGGGVTAGIDFGYVLLAAMRGEEIAKITQLAMEYDPQPPFNAGSPETAGPEITKAALATLAELQKETRATITEIMARRTP